MDNDISPGGAGPPLHHHDFDETFYVLEGELAFQLGDRLVTKGRGEHVFAPRGATHTFTNLSGRGARTLIVCTPAGFERYFDRMAAREAGVEPPPEALEPWPEVTKVGGPLDPAAEPVRDGPAPLHPTPDEGYRTEVLVRSEDSGGHVSVIRNSVPAAWPGPPLHRHDFDETWYVLEGELTLRVGEESLVAGPGELAFAPRGVPHTVANGSDSPARYLLICTPAGFERFFACLACEGAGVEPPAWALGPIPEVEFL